VRLERPALLALSLLALNAVAGTERRVSPSGASTAWVSTGQPFAIELIPVAPDSVRAMYARKDFPKSLQETVAAFCVLGTVIRNETAAALSYDTNDWRYTARGGKPQRPRNKDEWLALWREHGVDFSYSLLPTAQTFEPGDWAQGLTTLQLPRGTVFDLSYTWTQQGKRFSATLEGVKCASDSPP
jgi:hypothetical protein